LQYGDNAKNGIGFKWRPREGIGELDVSRRVVFIGPCYPFKGGVSKYAARLAQRLAQVVPLEMHTYARLYPRWLFPGRSEPEPVRAHNDVAFAVRDLSFLRPWTFYRLGCRLRREAGDGMEGVILTWWTAAWAVHSLLLCAGLRGRVPLVLWCHNVFDHGRRGLLTLPVKWLLKAADGFVVHSGSERARLEALAGLRPVGMAPLPPLHAGEFGDPAVAVRGGTAVFRLLFFGFVRPYKGVEDLLEALVAVCRQAPVELTIRGECWGGMHRTLVARVHELGLDGKVHVFDTYTPDDQLAGVFAGCDAVVLPYRSATGSGVVSLAHQFARPAIVTDVGSLPEAVVQGCNGWVCRAADPAGLAAVILQAVREPITPSSVRAACPDAPAAWNRLAGCLVDTLRQCAMNTQSGDAPDSGSSR